MAKIGGALTCWPAPTASLAVPPKLFMLRNKALDLAVQQHNEKLEEHLESNLEHYEHAAVQVR
jgi:hypothetical protein